MTKYIPEAEELEDTILALQSVGVHPQEGESQNDFVKRVLSELYDDLKDPHSVVERLTGKDYRDTFTASLLTVQLQGHAKRIRAQETVDTYWNMPWDEFTQVIEHHGFKEGLVEETNEKYGDGIFGIWYKPDDGFLLVVDGSTNGIGSPIIHCELDVEKTLDDMTEEEFRTYKGVVTHTQDERMFPGETHNDRFRTPIVNLSNDTVGGNLTSWMNHIRNSQYDLVSPWQRFDRHRLRLFSHYEDVPEDSSREEIGNRRLWALPTEVKNMLGFRVY